MLLDIKNLKTYYQVNETIIRAVDGISFKLEKGENLGLVGESGCGKTTAAKSINRVLPDNARIVNGEINFLGKDLASLNERELNRVRWKEIAMVTQSAMNALDPVYRVGDQIVEGILTHKDISRRQALERAKELFRMVGLETKRLKAYPHQLSGGMKQRVVIAMALSLEPDLIIADEPTTALDVVVQDGILAQFLKLQSEMNSSLILVTHDISVVAEICQRVAVMYAGRIVEQGTTEEIFNKSCHPYTLGLLNAFPTLETARGELISIPGSPPDLSLEHEGCLFAPRCPFSEKRCQKEPPQISTINTGHETLCHFPEKARDFQEQAKKVNTWMSTKVPEKKVPEKKDQKTVLTIQGIKKWFPVKRGLLPFQKDSTIYLRAVDGISLEVKDREILGVAGESGSGKSTLGEVIAHLQSPTEGNILYLGQSTRGIQKKLKAFRRNLQVVFQDPYETLNPRFTVLNTIMEPLKIHGLGQNYSQRVEMVKEALMRAELLPPENFLDRFPHQLSGGQRQRVALARAIVLEPKFIIADEPVSMLDVSIRAGILNLLRRLRNELGVSLIYISHDLATIRYTCDRTAILYLGRIVEIGDTEKVIQKPAHPYTRMLLAAVPVPDPQEKRERVDPRGEIPDPIMLPNGCRFHPRCQSALPSCGWEGRDLQQLLEELQEKDMLTPEEKSMLDKIEKIRVDKYNLLLQTKGNNAAEIEVIKILKGIMEKHRPPMLNAVEDFSTEGSTVKVIFSPQLDPELSNIGEGQAAACYLYQ